MMLVYRLLINTPISSLFDGSVCSSQSIQLSAVLLIGLPLYFCGLHALAGAAQYLHLSLWVDTFLTWL